MRVCGMKMNRIGMLKRASMAAMLLSVLAVSGAWATNGPGTVGAEYLTLPIGSRSLAMGEVQSAAIGEPLGWLSNPATLRCMDGMGFGVFHAEWFMETNYDNAAFHRRLDEKFSVAGGFVTVRRPEIMGSKADGTETGPLDNANYQAIIGMGYSPVPSFAAGLAIKYFNEELDESSADGVAFDIGALYTITKAQLSLGIVAQNVGPAITFESLEEPLPRTLRGGASHVAELRNGDATVTFALDVAKPRYERLYLSAGCELMLMNTVGVRVGYNGREDRPGSGLTLGCGAVVRNISVDYAWTAYGDLGSVHRIALYFTMH
jgi:hypothetical protein